MCYYLGICGPLRVPGAAAGSLPPPPWDSRKEIWRWRGSSTFIWWPTYIRGPAYRKTPKGIIKIHPISIKIERYVHSDETSNATQLHSPIVHPIIIVFIWINHRTNQRITHVQGLLQPDTTSETSVKYTMEEGGSCASHSTSPDENASTPSMSVVVYLR